MTSLIDDDLLQAAREIVECNQGIQDTPFADDEQEDEPDFHEAEDNKDDYFCHKRRDS